MAKKILKPSGMPLFENCEYTEDQIEHAICSKCNKLLDLEYQTKPDNNIISAVCCGLLYSICPTKYDVTIDEI